MATHKSAPSGKKRAHHPSALVAHQGIPLGTEFAAPTSIFISYRRQDTGAAAAHLHASLARRFGAANIFRDVATIEPGQDFHAVIDRAIAGTAVLIALIGRRWLVKGSDRRPRLSSPKDFVRLEIESALRHGITVIPVLVDGAKMPDKRELPASIAELAKLNAYELLWHEGVARLTKRIGHLERQRAAWEAAERAKKRRLNLIHGRRPAMFGWRTRSAAASFDSAISAMELSLARQGRSVVLDAKDFRRSLEQMKGSSVSSGWLAFQFQDLVYLIDIIGVKAKNSEERYVARSYPIASIEKLPGQLAMGRPVLAPVVAYQSWFEPPISETGFIDEKKTSTQAGGVVCVAVGWDPEKEELKLLTPWPKWGKKGIATLTKAAVAKSIPEFRAIEAAPMPRPSGAPSIEPAPRSRRRKRKPASR